MAKLSLSPTVGLALGLMAMIVMMVLPVPPIVLDVGLTASFAFAILVFTTTLFVERPLDFSAFPAIILVSLLLRLALNISSTKLIIGEGHTGTGAAGGVIEGFAMFIMGGNLGLGLIVFCVLIIVNFLVITKGAGRMAEVGARFALDAMPGKQLAIDADVAAGAISHEEAKVLRAREQEETAFLGSLDGVSKFVKGDAVAGLLITLLNLVAGIAIGMGVHGIGLGEAVQNYSVLTVGDGLVSQIPAVIISVAAALLLSKGRGEGAVDLALLRQLGGRREALATVAGVMVVFGLFPGLPILPFFAGAAGLGYAAWKVRPDAEEVTAPEPVLSVPEPTLGDLLDIDDVHVELATDLVPLVLEGEGSFDARVERIRRFVITEFGFVTPPVRVTDRADLEPGHYAIRVQGVEVAANVLRPGRHLALVAEDVHRDVAGEAVCEPVYGAAARWVDEAGKDRLVAEAVTVVDPTEVLATHLLETLQQQFPRLMTRRALRAILDAFTGVTDTERASANTKLLDDLVPERVPHDLLQTVLRDLLAERVSVRNLALILEAIAEARTPDARTEDVIEHVRRRLAFAFVHKLSVGGELPVVQVGQEWEAKFGDAAPLPAPVTTSLAGRVRAVLDQASEGGAYPAVATTSARRRLVRQVLENHGVRNPVLSFEEIQGSARPLVLGTA